MPFTLQFQVPPDLIHFTPPIPTKGEGADLVALANVGLYNGAIVTKVQQDGVTTVAPYDGATDQVPVGMFMGGSIPVVAQPEPVMDSGLLLTVLAASSPTQLRLINGLNRPCWVIKPTTPYTVGCPLYAGCAATGSVGQLTPDLPSIAVEVPAEGTAPATTKLVPVNDAVACGTCWSVPGSASTSKGPGTWLGVTLSI